MTSFPHLPLHLRRSCASAANVLPVGGKGGRRPFRLRLGFIRALRSWLRRRERYVKVAPHESAIVREPKFYTTHWMRLCGLSPEYTRRDP